MFTTCHKCQKQNDYWNSQRLKETISLNGKELYGGFNYSKFFCSLTERKARDKSLLSENQEKVLIIDCMNGDREEIREKTVSSVSNS